VLTFSQKPEWATNTHTLKRTQQTDDWLGENVTPILSGLSAKLPVSYGQDFGRHADLSVIACCKPKAHCSGIPFCS
jgi:phage FluMu gp28-like protein